MSLLTFQIDNLYDDRTALYCLPPGEYRPGNAYVQLSEDGVVTADCMPPWENGVPVSVFHDRNLRFYVSAGVDCGELASYLSDGGGLALLERICAGHSVEFDGQNLVGVLDDDAREAREALDAELERIPCVEVWSARDWIAEALLNEVWPGDLSLEEAALECLNSVTDDFEIEGDMHEALLDKADLKFRDDEDMEQVWLDALVSSGRITLEEASEYV